MSHFRPQKRNINKHTEKGLRELGNSIQRDGWIGAITTAADGETFDGSARLETLANVMPDVTPIVVETDGHTPVIIKRIDIPNVNDPRAKRLAVDANVIHRLDFDPDVEILAGLAFEDAAIAELLKQDGQIAVLLVQGNEVIDPLAEWQGMPDLAQKDVSAFKSIVVHFLSMSDVESFAKLIEQTVTEQTKSVWYPKRTQAEPKVFVSDES